MVFLGVFHMSDLRLCCLFKLPLAIIGGAKNILCFDFRLRQRLWLDVWNAQTLSFPRHSLTAIVRNETRPPSQMPRESYLMKERGCKQ